MNNKWTVLFVLAISLSRVGIGLFQSISGPTLPVLAKNVNTAPEVVSWIFTARSIGMVVGAVLASLTSQKWNGMFQLTLSYSICALSIGVIPIVTDFWLLVIIVTAGGGIVGFNDALIQSILLSVWGESRSASILQLHHFTYSIGAFLAPLIVAPFYGSTNIDVEEICNFNSTDSEDDSVSEESQNDIIIPYLICCGFMIVVTIFMASLYKFGIILKITKSHEDTIDNRKEHSISVLIWYFIPLTFFYFAAVGGECTFYANIFSYATCAVKLNPTESTILNSLFFAGFGFGRGSGIFLSKFLKPSWYILLDSAGIIMASVILVIYYDTEKILWAMTFFYGLFVATLYSCGMSYTHYLTNISNKWIFVFGVGSTIGAMSMPILGTNLVFSDDPNNFLWMLVGLSCCTLGSFICMHFLGYKAGPLPLARKQEVYGNGKEEQNPSEEPNPSFGEEL